MMCHAKEHVSGGATWKKMVRAAMRIREKFLANEKFKQLFQDRIGASLIMLPDEKEHIFLEELNKNAPRVKKE